MQGDLEPALQRIALGGLLLVLPLLWAIGRPQPPWSPGSFGLDWWIMAASTFNGVFVTTSGWYVLLRLARRSAAALDGGYGWAIVALVATDLSRDAGFILQGRRAFSMLNARERRALLRMRLARMACFTAAALWLPVGLALAVVLAAAGTVGIAGLWFTALGPSVILAAFGVLVGSGERTLGRAARTAWFEGPWSEDLEQKEAEAWRQAHAGLQEEGALPAGAAGWGRSIRVLVATGLAVTVVALLPPVTLVGMSSVSALLARFSAPEYGAAAVSAASVDPLRSHALLPDTTVTPAAAGEAFHAVTFVGRASEPRPYENPPARRYGQPWLPDEILGEEKDAFLRRLNDIVASAPDGLEPEDVERLIRVASHPAHVELELLGRAAALDAAGARWPLPLPEGLQLVQLPNATLSAFREGAHAHVARAALALHDGRTAEAERTLRSVISAGLLVADHGPTVLDNLMGLVVARIGGEALITFLGVTGREGEAAALRASLEAAGRAAERLAARSPSPDPGDALARTPALVLDSLMLRGVRWETFGTYSTLGPCTNVHRIVFGPDPRAWDPWLEAVRGSLVRFESEEALFELTRRGWFARTGEARESRLAARILGLPFGGRGRPGSCAAVLGEVSGVPAAPAGSEVREVPVAPASPPGAAR